MPNGYGTTMEYTIYFLRFSAANVIVRKKVSSNESITTILDTSSIDVSTVIDLAGSVFDIYNRPKRNFSMNNRS